MGDHLLTQSVAPAIENINVIEPEDTPAPNCPSTQSIASTARDASVVELENASAPDRPSTQSVASTVRDVNVAGLSDTPVPIQQGYDPQPAASPSRWSKAQQLW
ncbi:MAG: hypothetical protein M1840_004188 [Geoglossum simile]|nr:MAG: hypothetical protein M1840_004188 [Geoglossum simile]